MIRIWKIPSLIPLAPTSRAAPIGRLRSYPSRAAWQGQLSPKVLACSGNESIHPGSIKVGTPRLSTRRLAALHEEDDVVNKPVRDLVDHDSVQVRRVPRQVDAGHVFLVDDVVTAAIRCRIRALSWGLSRNRGS